MLSLGRILDKFHQGDITKDQAERLILRAIRVDGFERVADIAKLDTGRAHRTGAPEVILAEGKSTTDLTAIIEAQLRAEGRAILTRVSDEQLRALKRFDIQWHEKARIATIGHSRPIEGKRGVVGIVCAGTADVRVAEEARIIAEEFGCGTIEAYDVGVAGIHRLYPELPKLLDADVLVVVAGREGTLPTVIAGLTDIPVIGVPVSTGYGFGGQGKAALLAMLQSCSVLAVVNIDAGFVAGAFAAKIARRIA
ncbi:MAG: nickel pincer cofactor biosynthesis protein LarB [Euryarchaeota archaeon]|nr:nickel pincer cofactor biosynthesis protein LarB [Euryarchaeota archaeon]